MMKKILLLLLSSIFTIQVTASEGNGYIQIFKTDGTIDSVKVEGLYNISHSRMDASGYEHPDYVTMIVKTSGEVERRYAMADIVKVVMPDLREPLYLSGERFVQENGIKRIHFHGNFPNRGADKAIHTWDENDTIYIKMAEQDVVYDTKLEEMTADSTYATFNTVMVRKKEEPVKIYYPGHNAPAYNKVRIKRVQTQQKVNDTRHVATSGDCASAVATRKDESDNKHYSFMLNHHPAFFAFLTHNKRLPSVKVDSITMICDKPISGVFTFDTDKGIDLSSVEDGSNTVTLRTPFFNDNGWKHTPRSLENSQDSTAAYMVVAPQENVNIKFIFSVRDTLSLIDTTFVKEYKGMTLRPNTFYSVNAEIPDTLFSIVDLGLGDIKYSFRNVEAYFERGAVANYGGAFSYGESNTKNDYSPGYGNSNYRGGAITKEFVPNYDAAYQRWGGCWRMMQNCEADTLLRRCKTEWREYNGVEGVLVTGPSGKRIFLPSNDNCSNYWSIDRSKNISDFYYTTSWGTHYYKIPILGINKNRTDSVLYQNYTEFYQPGYCRGILEYSNYIKSGTTFDGSLMLLRHVGEQEAGNGNFTINGIARSVRPWPEKSRNLQLDETGFIFGTDSVSLYYNKDIDKEWTETLFVDDAEFRPVGGKHVKLKDNSKTISAYQDASITVELSSQYFLGYLDKEQKYYVREYARIGDDYYYASKATPIRGFFPHTDNIRWQVGDTDATFNGKVVGVSSEVVGKVGFVVSDSIYDKPTLANGKLYLSDNGEGYSSGDIRTDMTFSCTINDLERKYYFVRAAFVSFSEKDGKQDTTCIYAPEVKILHPLDTIDLGLSTKWANINVGAQFPEDADSTYVWNSGGELNTLITDISGTEHDATFRKWFGKEGWTLAMPTPEQLQALIDSCEFEPIIRFDRKVLKVTGPNGRSMYMPYNDSGYSNHSPNWTSQRPWKDMVNAYQGGFFEEKNAMNLRSMVSKLWIRPVVQTNCTLSDKSLMFVSTDTVGLSTDHSKVEMWGRVLGVKPHMLDKTITRGFVLHDHYGGTLDDVDNESGFSIQDNVTDNLFNGLYSDEIPTNVIDKMDSNKDYWYRAFITVGDETFYGMPKKIMPLTIKIDDIEWEVHENKATLRSEIVGTIFIKDRINNVETGFVVGDTPDITIDKKESQWLCLIDGEIKDGKYTAVMDVPQDTIYWVRAYIKSDGKIRYSEPRQFGLDYVDLGLPSKALWANISVGSTYPEDKADYFSIGESFTKLHYHQDTYIDDEIKYINIKDGDAIVAQVQSTDSVILKHLTCMNAAGNKTYSIPYRGATHEIFHCEAPQYWKHYSGTKNDAAYVNWGNDNPKFKDTEKYISNNKYGNLFVEPNTAEWTELRDYCSWTLTKENDIDGYKVTGPNGNSIFLPFNGLSRSSYTTDRSASTVNWKDEISNPTTTGFYHVADSALMVSLSAGHPLGNFDVPSYNDSYNTLTWSEFYMGQNVRPIARYNLPLTKGAEKLSNETLAYLRTDSVTYLEYRTAVALQGSFRINHPIAEGYYDLGFIVGDRADITVETCSTKHDVRLRNASQYFTVLDENNNLESDKTYYFRFYLHTGGNYYYADADTFHLANHLTGKAEWEMYSTNAKIHGTVQGVMATEAASGLKAGLIIGNERELTVENATDNIECTAQLNERHVGPISANYTLTADDTYYFRTYVLYNGKYHYGDINLFGYELVDLNLPSGKKWASINVGGTSPLDGSYINALSEHYGLDTNTKPVSSPGTGSYRDASHNRWHNVNRMPYYYEMQELINECTWTADTIYGCPGVRVTGSNGNSIFLRSTINYYKYADHSDYSLAGNNSGYYMRIPQNNDADPSRHKGTISSWSNHDPGCRGIDFLRPIWESNVNVNGDEMLIRTDDAIIHPQVDNVSFFGSFIGSTQQRLGGEPYKVPEIKHVGFVIGTDTLVTHNKSFKYDFPLEDINTDSIFFNNTANINLFKVDTTYWARAYVLIGDEYHYARSVKFVRQPNIVTGDVEWKVGKQTAILHGSVIGFNNDFSIAGSEDNGELVDMEEISKNARVGIIVGYVDNLTHESPSEAIVKSYDLGKAVNGSFSISVPYERDTTYYYRAFIYYNNKYVYGKYTNHYGLEFVNLGLPMQWASISVGSRFAEDECEQYAWGDTISSPPFKFDNYRFYNATGDDEYNNLNNEIKGSVHDVAHVKWNYTWDEATYGGRGSLWAMPSEEDLQMLADSCVWTDSISHGIDGKEVVGYKVKGPNGNSIFINKKRCDEWTMSGYHSGIDGPWEYGPLWSSSRAPKERNALGMETGTSRRLMKYHYRYHGHYVRPIAHINVTLPETGKKMSITTERTSWVAGDKSATIYGCVLGTGNAGTVHYGFLIGNDKKNLVAGAAGTQKVECHAEDDAGLFSYTIPSVDNQSMYYFRSYLEAGGSTFYGDIKEFGIVMVDLGLTSGTKWANVNLGSWKDKDHGDYYAWGETTSKDVFNQAAYKYFNTVTNSYRDIGNNICGNDTTDVAQKHLGGLWRMAGDEEWQELISECDWKQDTVAHIPGYRAISKKNGNSIFLPSNYYNANDRDANYDLSTNEDGYQGAVNHDDEVTHRGYYWSSVRATNHTMAREVLFIDSIATKGIPPRIMENFRWRGNCIRPVAVTNRGNFYIRTEGTDWRYRKDSVNFYSVILDKPSGSKAGFLVGTTPDMTATTAEVIDIKANPSVLGGGDYVGVMDESTLNDGTYYYRAYLKEEDGTYHYGDSRQFGLTPVDMGTGGLQWADINVDTSSPEEFGLNGIPTGKYAEADPAYVEFGGLWRLPSDEEKQQLLDDCDWTLNDESGKPISLYGIKVWKVTNRSNPANYIYMTSNNPSEWGYRAVSQTNLTLDDGNRLYLRTDSTNWKAGYTGNKVYATLVGTDNIVAATGKGFVIGKTEDVTTETEGSIIVAADSIATSAFVATIPDLGIGTYYYRAFITYEGKDYYAPQSLPLGIEFIDLGLPSGTKWANVNVGSTVSTDNGDNYSWGDTTARKTFTVDNYPYHTDKGYTHIGMEIGSDSRYDVAALSIDGCHTPGYKELQELKTYCTWTTETLNGVEGYRISATNGNSIFLPVGGYWTSTRHESDDSKAYSLTDATVGNDVRYAGRMIRPVTSLITTMPPTGITNTEAELNGFVNTAGIASVTVGFELSRSADMEGAVVLNVTVDGNGSYTHTARELSEGSPYYYRAFVETGEGKHYGTTITFTTKSTESTEPEAIDLGLSVKWGDRNVGSSLPELNGDYYAWGETKTQLSYTTVTYTHNVYDKYVYIGKNISASEYDIATAKFAGCWRMPTLSEINELKTRCKWTWADKEGVPGYWVENVASHTSIFLPASGYHDVTYLKDDASKGYYWAATSDNGSDAYANAMIFNSQHYNDSYVNTNGIRYRGFTIRPVYQSNAVLNGRDVFIRTDSISYNADRTLYTLYGTMLGMESESDNITHGFVIGTAEDVDLSTSVVNGLSGRATENGSYNYGLTEEQITSLKVGERYFVRAFVSYEDYTAYGNAKEITDYTFFTDDVDWGLGTNGNMHGHIKSQKAEGLEVGFMYSTNSDMSDSHSVVATFDEADPNAFTGVITTVKVATYYYQAYTKLNGITHKGEIKSFGAKVVDLGLTSGVKWVDMNLGADNEEATGDTYRWGETKPYDSESGEYSVPPTFTFVGGTDYDAAHVRLGTEYRLPSTANIQELIDECEWQWDVNGYRITSKKNGNSIFLPLGDYWSSQQGEGDSSQATAMSIDTTNRIPDALKLRTSALLMRPTLNPSADMAGGGNGGTGEIGGGIEGNE